MRILIFAILLLIPVHVDPSVNVFKSPIEKAREFIKSNRPVEALRAIAGYQPAAEELALYHYVHAKAYELAGRQYDSLAHFRLAYLYSRPGELKELAMLERAEAYLKMRHYHEAILSLRIFLKNFPDSRYAEKAQLELADSLYKSCSFNEAIECYEKAGSSARAIYGKANAYQSMGRIKDAYELYMSMSGREKEYLNSSEETLYNIAENLRQMGKPGDAKVYFNTIKDFYLKQKAGIGLGLIAMEEERFDSAIKYFASSSQSPDRQLRRQALLHLADAYIKTGKLDNAKSRLLEIRNKYPYGKEYDTALLMLFRLYKKEGKFNEAISLVKELILRGSPDKIALDEFENIILEAKNRDADEFLKLWRSAGHCLLEISRSQSLLEIAKGLKFSGRPFLNLGAWLLRYGSNDVKVQTRLILADFYAEMGDAERASQYLGGIKGANDDILRIKSRIYNENKEYQKATEAIISIKDIKQEDIVFLLDIASAKNIKKAVEFCERALNKMGGPSEAYTKLADAFYEMGRESDALKYYRIVIAMKPEDKKDLKADDREWAYYMVSRLSAGKDSTEMLNIQKGNTTLSRLAEAGLKESNILERIKRGL
jgi:tetratricopeptide (TPR) repeat protein